MVGSGTVVALGRALGHQTIGVDIDPLAVLISKVWATSVDCGMVRRKAIQVFLRAQKTSKIINLRDSYPRNADHETRMFVRYWFDNRARRQLTSLSLAIQATKDVAARDVLWCAFSRLIITKQAGASLAMDLAHSRPHKFYKAAPIEPFDNFISAVDRVLDNCISRSKINRGPAPLVRQGDARKLRIASASIDLVLTSPPYINALDYMRCSKFSLIWMGYTIRHLRRLRGSSIGSEVGEYCPGKLAGQILREARLEGRLSVRHTAILSRFIQDMLAAVFEVERVLVPGGRVVYVLGDNNLRGAYVPNSRIITAIAMVAGLELESRHTRVLPPNRRYLPPPTKARVARLDARLSREVVLSFRKPNG
jgi:DNA modification methylase